jgi:glutamate-5-semialdehyde dehydrogenase
VVSPELAARFQPGDHLLVEQVSGELLLIPVADQQAASVAIARAEAAFTAMSLVSDQAISTSSICLPNVWKTRSAGP